MKNIVLIGMMGSPKTSTGRAIAEKLNMPFFDGDEVYVAMFSESISETFEKHGEQEFRRREVQVYQKLGALDGAVIACGGGVVLNQENMTALKSNGVIVQLTASPEAIYERVKRNDKRPLVREGGLEKIKQIMSDRKSLYDEYADVTVDNTYLLPKKSADIVINLYRKFTK